MKCLIYYLDLFQHVLVLSFSENVDYILYINAFFGELQFCLYKNKKLTCLHFHLLSNVLSRIYCKNSTIKTIFMI